MVNEQQEFIDSTTLFQVMCGNDKAIVAQHRNIQKAIFVNKDIPLVLIGLFQNITMNEPQYYWDKNVTEEIYKRLNDLFKSDENLFSTTFNKSLEHLFNALNAYDYIVDHYNELHDVSLSDDIKTIVYRNPVYIQICENCLMNSYRTIRNIINEFSSKDYLKQETLGQIIPVLKKHHFDKSISINTNYRNAINHGKSIVNNDTITFQYNGDNGEVIETIPLYEFDYLIEKTFDIATGVIVGFLKLLTINSDLLNYCLSNTQNESIRFEWFKLCFRSQNTKILYCGTGRNDNSQLNIHIRTSIKDKTNLFGALIQILKGAYYSFPDYDRYFIGYKHNRSYDGWIAFDSEELKTLIENLKTDKDLSKITNGDIMMWDIQSYDVDERAFKFHMFPKVVGNNWFLTNIHDITIEDFKRIKANLIIEKKLNKDEIKNIILDAIEKTKNLNTPKNPKYELPFGPLSAPIVIFYVFLKNEKRHSFTLFPENNNFICIAEYYENDKAPRLKFAGTNEKLWKRYKKEKADNIQIAWNPKC